MDEVIGHITLQNMLQDAFGDGERGIDAHFVKLPPMSRADRIASGWMPGLGRLDLDLQPVLRHLVQAARARRVVRQELERQPYDVLHVNSHSIAFALGRVMGSVPTVLSADSSVWRGTSSASGASPSLLEGDARPQHRPGATRFRAREGGAGLDGVGRATAAARGTERQHRRAQSRP